MSWCLYLINKTKNVYISVGKTNEDEFTDYCKSISKALDDEFFDEDIIYEINDSKLIDLTIRQLRSIFSAIQKIEIIYGTNESISLVAALLYLKWKGDDMSFEVDPDMSDSAVTEL